MTIVLLHMSFQENSSSLDLKWLLSAIATRIESNGQDKNYVIDIMPSLRYFYKVSGLVNDCSTPLQEFETKVGQGDKTPVLKFCLHCCKMIWLSSRM